MITDLDNLINNNYKIWSSSCLLQTVLSFFTTSFFVCASFKAFLLVFWQSIQFNSGRETSGPWCPATELDDVFNHMDRKMIVQNFFFFNCNNYKKIGKWVTTAAVVATTTTTDTTSTTTATNIFFLFFVKFTSIAGKGWFPQGYVYIHFVKWRFLC